MARRSSALLFSEFPWSILLVFFYALSYLIPATYFIAPRSMFPTSPFVASDGHLSGNPCQLNRSTQHFLEVYSQEFEILEFFFDADLTAAPLCPDPLAYSRTGQFSSGS